MDAGLCAEKTLATLNITKGPIVLPRAVAERAALIGPNAITLAIINLLVRNASDYGDVYLVAEHAMHLLETTTELQDTVEYQRLRTALKERGSGAGERK